MCILTNSDWDSAIHGGTHHVQKSAYGLGFSVLKAYSPTEAPTRELAVQIEEEAVKFGRQAMFSRATRFVLPSIMALFGKHSIACRLCEFWVWGVNG